MLSRSSIIIRTVLITGITVGLVLLTLLYLVRTSVREFALSTKKEQISRLFNDQAKVFNQMARERARMAGSAARVAESIVRLKKQDQPAWSESQWDGLIAADLRSELQRFPESVRLGVWFEPGMFSPKQRLRGYSASLAPEGIIVTQATDKEISVVKKDSSVTVESGLIPKQFELLNGSDYQRQKWYGLLLGGIPYRASSGEPADIWYGPFGESSENGRRSDSSLLMLVGTAVRDDNDSVLGVATAVWDLHHLVADLDQLQPTSTSQAFLIVPQTATFAAVANRQDLSEKDVGAVAWGSFALGLPDSEAGAELNLATGNRLIFKTTLQTGLLFGLVVPETELLAPVIALERELLAAGIFLIVAITTFFGLLVWISPWMKMRVFAETKISPFVAAAQQARQTSNQTTDEDFDEDRAN